MSQYLFIFIFFIAFIYPAYKTFIETRQYSNSLLDQEREAYLLSKIIKQYPTIRNIKILCKYDEVYLRHYDVINYYQKLYKENSNISVEKVSAIDQLKINDSIIVNQRTYKDSIKSSKSFKIISENQDILFFKRI